MVKGDRTGNKNKLPGLNIPIQGGIWEVQVELASKLQVQQAGFVVGQVQRLLGDTGKLKQVFPKNKEFKSHRENTSTH